MKRNATEMMQAAILASVLIVLATGVTVRADEVIWQQDWDLQNYWGPSQKSQANPGQLNKELADDFDIYGSISRVDVEGVNSFYGAGNAPFFGLYVRFYELGDDGKPGALQAQYYLPTGSPNLWINWIVSPGSFHATLSPPFQAAGRHFVAVQTLMNAQDGSNWEWDSANTVSPNGEAFYYRDLNGADTSWHHLSQPGSNADLAMTVWGTAQPAPPHLYSVSGNSVTRAGRLKIDGAHFGAEQGSAFVSIGGVPAWVTRWSDTQITAYVAEETPVGPVDVQVVTSIGSSNDLPLTVTLRPPPDGRVKWRFVADSYYILHRPAIGSDGTIYAVDITGVLYALTPNGGLKWIVRFDEQTYGTVAIGADDTVYVAGLFNTVTAVNPDGTVKWQFTESPIGQGVFAGPAVGPDGNIYAVTDWGGLGAFALSPQGQVLWNIPGFEIYGGGDEEIVFGPPDQFYFIEVHQGSPSMLNAVSLDGQLQWQYNLHLAPFMTQAAVGPDGTVYTRWYSAGTSKHLEAVNPDGTFKWALFSLNLVNMISAPDVGLDGRIYLVGNLAFVHAIEPGGTIQWVHTEYFTHADPILNPQNTLLLMGGVEGSGGGQPTFVKAVDTKGEFLWRVDLPFENGVYISTSARPRFTPDGNAAYIGTTGNNYAEDIYCYLYAINTSDTIVVGDLDGDALMGPADLALLLGSWGTCVDCPADLNADGAVDAVDLALLLGSWG